VEIKSSGSQRIHKTRHIKRTVSFIDYYYLIGDINTKSFSRNARQQQIVWQGNKLLSGS